LLEKADKNRTGPDFKTLFEYLDSVKNGDVKGKAVDNGAS